MSDLKAKMAEFKARGSAAQKAALRKYVIALAIYRGTDDDLLEEAYKEVHDPAGRKVLLAVFTVTRQITEADFYRHHSAFVDTDAPEQDAQAQIREAHENRDKVLDSIVDRLLNDVPKYIEEPLAKFAAGQTRWAGLAADGLAEVAITVAAIRELCDDQSSQLSPESGAIADTHDEYV